MTRMARWIDGLEQQAEQRLSPNVYEYFRGGAGSEASLAEAEPAWDALRLRPRMLRDVSSVSAETTVLGIPLRTPILIAPSALHFAADERAEVATAEGAAAAGSLLCVSSTTTVSYPSIAEAGAPWWAQVYVLGDRGLTRELLGRARDAGASAIVLTVDSPLLGDRKLIFDAHITPAPGMPGPHYGGMSFTPTGTGNAKDLTFEDIAWIAAAAGLPVLVKGILRGDDAAEAVRAGAAGVIVSNHGARQLDPVVSSAWALPEVVRALEGTDAPVIVDGGIRRGTHVLAALALGAHAVLLGRPVLWALTVGGADLVARLIDDLTAELELAMTLSGAGRLAEVSPDLVASERH
ncbi:MAG TPA: alpha-hydroxy acid oxidase [Pseudonocardiaceae bacterium]|jgi:4-hydroxymandelate oxidase|nr:alpha-hydroxy acid oxidase [Pseudonocardiaceae bacterium]